MIAKAPITVARYWAKMLWVKPIDPERARRRYPAADYCGERRERMHSEPISPEGCCDRLTAPRTNAFLMPLMRRSRKSAFNDDASFYCAPELLLPMSMQIDSCPFRANVPHALVERVSGRRR